MNQEQEMVQEFHQTFYLPVRVKPEMLQSSEALLALSFIDEERGELGRAISKDDLIETIDALGDMLYVIYGYLVRLGVDIEPIFEEIHRSNMTKNQYNSEDDGKITKGEQYSPPDIKSILRKQTN